MNDVLTRRHYDMFGPNLDTPNAVICIKGPSAKHFSVLAADRLCNEKFCGTNDGGTFLIPLYVGAHGIRSSNVTSWALKQFQEHYGDPHIRDADIFAYVYAALHDPVYREAYAIDLLQEFPRLPFHDNFREWVRIGQELLDLHIGFETVEAAPLERIDTASPPGKPMLRANKSDGEIRIDNQTRLLGVAPEAWEYILASRSALEWVLDQYKETKPRDPTIRKKFDTYRVADHKEQMIDLLRRVCTVSVRTVELINQLPNGTDR